MTVLDRYAKTIQIVLRHLDNPHRTSRRIVEKIDGRVLYDEEIIDYILLLAERERSGA